MKGEALEAGPIKVRDDGPIFLSLDSLHNLKDYLGDLATIEFK